MATTIPQAFSQFITNLNITDYQIGLVSEHRKNVVSAISKEIVLHSESPSKLIGSYDRYTLTRYLSEGDVDVMVVLHYQANKDWHNPDGTIKALDRFKSILDKAYPNTKKERDRNCITMRFSEFRLDVVPAFMTNEGSYIIPDSIRKNWVPTDPIKFADRITAVNKRMSNTFIPLIKMVKGWNRNQGWFLRSFHLECMMYKYFGNYTTFYTYPYMLKEFFSVLPSYVASYTYDPVMGDQVDSYLDNPYYASKRQIAIEKAKNAAQKSYEAYNDQEKYPILAMGKWKELMGDFFPSYG